jgi:hypothetical protein
VRYEGKSQTALRPLSELREVKQIHELHGGRSHEFAEARVKVARLIESVGLDLFVDEAAARYAALKRMPYAEFLKSPEWAEVRSAALELAGHRCQVCSGKEQLQVHHRNYANLPVESLADLTVLCDECHGVFHANRRLKAA